MRVVALAAVVSLASSTAAEVVPTLDRLAHAYIASAKVEGISIAVVRCGSIRFVAAGTARVGHTPTPDTVFEIGSLSKLMTGLLLARAVTQGKASLQDDVRRYLPPGFATLQWNDGTPIRLGQLADTTSGLPDYLPDPAPLASLPPEQALPAAARLLADYSDHAFMRDLAGVRLRSRPGSEARHSNVAAQLLGLILSRIYGRPYASVLRQEIEAPLAMRPGTTAPPPYLAAVGHDGSGKQAPLFGGPSVMPAGGLRYSARDMARFIQLQLSPDPAVNLSHRARATSPDGDVAFTWVVSSPRPGVQRYRLTGSTFGFSSYVEVHPVLGYGVALLANRGAGDVQNELMAIAEKSFASQSLRPCRRRTKATALR